MTTPEGIGPQLERAQQGSDPRGILVFSSLPSELQRGEDATAVCDRDRHRMLDPRGHQREASEAERILLQYLGFELPEQLTTKVTWPSRSVRRRTWPQLEE